MLGALFALVLVLSQAAPARAADTRGSLLAQLDTCDALASVRTGPRLDILLALADGRSGRELATLIQGPRQCSGYVLATGEGEDEVVLVGAALPTEPNVGAVLWVDHGWWRAAAATVGYAPWLQGLVRRGDTRELIVGIASGGSAGYIGAAGIRIEGASATPFWRVPPQLSFEMSVRVLDDDHLFVQGRSNPDPLFTWQAHVGWPGGAQRMYARAGDTFVLAASRQTHDPDWIFTGFIGGMFDGDETVMSRFATPEAVTEGLALPRPERGPWVGPLQLVIGKDAIDRERASWIALPERFRASPVDGPVFGLAAFYVERTWRPLMTVLFTFERDDDGWTITAVRPLDLLDGGAHLDP